ncbi:hypothetical protein ACFQZI_20780 [Mucilaginibacter lutimaris]|uniref:KTSC domain-containing protein n=1 Tax=Mucilaginibacter lutimaris TaxID=931629 RepID=A0ABW2ZMD6_9SPHI
MNFKKSQPIIPFKDFKKLILQSKEFESVPKQKKYKVTRIDNDIIHFIRLDADPSSDWSFDIKDIYNAYINLDNYTTSSFKNYVPRKHSPARGILSHLKLIEPSKY